LGREKLLAQIPEILRVDMKACPPILLIVFNRPNLAAKVFDSIRRQRPAKLYIAADGPRDPRIYPNDGSRCVECCQLAEKIDWPCQVFTRFSKSNLGCGIGVSSAVTWFFENEESGIILEDDCLPADDFFPFCAELLEIYRNKNEVMSICGNIFGSPKSAEACGGYSYAFGRYAQVWGWASWARAWKLYQYDVGIAADDFHHFKTSGVSIVQQKIHQERVKSTLAPDGPDTWDYQWQFAVLKHGGLVACPSVNLISNIGFGEDATHTKRLNSQIAEASTGRLAAPLKHPPVLGESPALNRIYAEHMFGRASKLHRKFLKSWLRSLFGF
jgi:hypothetical protein